MWRLCRDKRATIDYCLWEWSGLRVSKYDRKKYWVKDSLRKRG